ncbi:MAG: DUF1553 domain-containing protein [Gemmataceae bacterium]|nr:DUF1553 domain-containing protein [Gemmataceae bacterium]
MIRTPAWLVLFAGLSLLPAAPADENPVKVEVLEGIPDKRAWSLDGARTTESYSEPGFALVAVPRKFNTRGLILDRSSPFVLRAEGKIELPAGEVRLLLRSRNSARLFIDGRLVLETGFIKVGGSHEAVPNASIAKEKDLAPLPMGHQEKLTKVRLPGGAQTIRLEAMVGGQGLRPELGEVYVGMARDNEPFHLLGTSVSLGVESWDKYLARSRSRHQSRDRQARTEAQTEEVAYWQRRHALARRELTDTPAPVVPAVAAGTPVFNPIDRFIGRKLEDKGVASAALTDDHTFLRRVTLDTTGLPPTPAEIDAFLRDRSADRRAKVIDRLLADARWADHWVGYWQDVLAENPGILKPTLNNTGPFRWWLHQAFLDNYPFDRFATELMLMEGSVYGGGPVGFAVATQNDAPMAAKAHVLARAFLGADVQCARCHDAPHQPFKQKDVFSMAAMLAREPLKVPATSSVKMNEGGRKPRVAVTLQPGVPVSPAWTLTDLVNADLPADVLRAPRDSREQLAVIFTSPRNDRFARVIVNRLWKRYVGAGLVEPVDDWNDARASHPDLLNTLGRELVTHGYDLKHVARLILNSHCYQREAKGDGGASLAPENRLFAAPARRRLSAEQIVDSLFAVAGKEFGAEELTLDPEGRQRMSEMLNLGTPRRAWEFTSLSNDRDRPALSLPVTQSVIDVLTAFGWRDARQNPLTVRDETPTALQPLLLANGTVGSRITRLSDDSALTDVCLEDKSVGDLTDSVYLRVLGRLPTAAERETCTELLEDGFTKRRTGAPAPPRTLRKRSSVSWANHLSPEATRIKLELERAARAGDPPTERLTRDWRERMEDMLWALVNSPEFVFIP